jgi:RNA polymerase sigma-70 factor (ECF subfamily)
MPPQQEPYRDIDSLIRATHSQLAGTAFRCLGSHADAEDAVQEACVKVMRSWPRVCTLATAGQQRAYLLQIVVNETSQIRQRPYWKREFPGVEAAEPGRIPGHLDDDGQAASHRLRLVWKAISELPEGRREVTALYAAGYTYKEISAMLGLSVSTVRSHVSLARRHLSEAVPDSRGEGQK